jgi:hypothetical protein
VVELTSRPGEGALFMIIVPALAQEAAVQPAPHP